MLTGAVEHFDQGMGVAEDAYFSSFDYSDGYDLADPCLDNVYSPEKRRSSGSSIKGISRIGSRVSTVSTRWKPGHSSVGADEDASLPYDPRSQANSASSAFASPAMSPITRVDASISPSPARAIFEEPVSESATRPIDIAKPNHENDDSAPQATTPLLPPFMGDDPTSSVASRVQSPLQSPSVAGMTEEPLASSITELRLAGVPSPPLSSKPSIASFGRPTHTVRSTSGDASPFTLSDPKDEWANKLGHANFTIQPEPYVPEAYDMETFQHFRGQWDLARCNFAKHLVRTGEHYGVTSNIYRLTEEKWESINREWKHHHESMLSELDPSECAGLNQTKSHHPCEQLKIPRLHDNDKFPELGDQEIVGPMKMAPAMGMSGPCRNRSLKRDFVRFFHGLVTRS